MALINIIGEFLNWRLGKKVYSSEWCRNAFSEISALKSRTKKKVGNAWMGNSEKQNYAF